MSYQKHASVCLSLRLTCYCSFPLEMYVSLCPALTDRITIWTAGHPGELRGWQLSGHSRESDTQRIQDRYNSNMRCHCVSLRVWGGPGDVSSVRTPVQDLSEAADNNEKIGAFSRAPSMIVPKPGTLNVGCKMLPVSGVALKLSCPRVGHSARLAAALILLFDHHTSIPDYLLHQIE